MPIYTVQGPDGRTYKIEGPAGATAEQLGEVITSGKPEKTTAQKFAQGVGNLVSGGIRGAGSIGATLIRPFETAQENDERRKAMDDALQSLGADPESLMYQGGKLAGEIAGTAGAGGVVANGLVRAAPMVAKAAPAVANAMTKVAPAIQSGGFTGANMGTRIAGGAVSGGAQSALVGDNPLFGAAVGGALPPVAKMAGKTGAAIGRGVMAALTPQQQAMAANIAKMTGKPLQEVLDAVRQQGPTILSIKPTVPQILQDDAVSQLQRSVINAGDTSIMQREAAQNAERVAGFGRVAPVFETVNEAADNAGNLIGNYAKSARANESEKVRRMFDSVDPFGDTAIELPIDAMKQSKAKFLGPGTFGKGNAPTTAIDVAERIGTTVKPGYTIPAIKPIAQSQAKTQSLEQAVRAAGGIKGVGGEFADLGRKQSGTTGLINSKSGKPADLLAQQMYERGFISEPDPALLLDTLRNGGGRNVFASDMNENAMQRAMDEAAGDLPGAQVIPDQILMKPVPFEQVQNLRGSLNEAWKDASMRGRNQEAAALKSMIGDIDSKVNAVASGKGNAGEAFPADIVQTWREALAAHAEKKARFDTGPQARMFRQGGDGQAAIQGAEIPREFFNGRASQIEDAQAFQRLTQSNPTLAKALKSYAMTDAAQQTTKDGMLSASKLTKWAESRSGALKQTMSEQDRALINEIVRGVQAADSAATRGMAKGSNTAQNQEAARRLLGNGMLDSGASNILFNRIPIVGSFTGPLLDSLRKTSQAGKAEKLGGLLSDPDVFAAELQKFMARPKIEIPLNDPRLGLLGSAAYRSAPLLVGGQ